MEIYDLVRETIMLGGYNLKDKLRELTSIMLVKQITIEEYDMLTNLATEHANAEPEETDTNILGALKSLTAEIAKIGNRVTKLEIALEEEPEEDEYPIWERWDGLPTSGYVFGSKVTHLGVKYKSIFVGKNVWEPGSMNSGNLWEVVG